MMVLTPRIVHKASITGWHRPLRDEFGNLLIAFLDPVIGIENGIGVILHDDLVRRQLEVLVAEPTIENRPPGLDSRVDPSVAKKEGLQLLTSDLTLFHRRPARADRIAHGLMDWVRHPDRCEFARA